MSAGGAVAADNAVTRWEFGDQPDFDNLHFAGSPNEFYEMYAAAARAVKRVCGLNCSSVDPAPLFRLDKGPYREGFLDFVKHSGQPLDFFTWMWFTDGFLATRWTIELVAARRFAVF